MRRRKPRVKDFTDQAIIILEKQKHDDNFTRYARAILTERYLEDSVSFYDLSKKLNKSRSKFQKEILWGAITTKLLVEENCSEIIRIYNAIEKLPIDNLVKLSQKAIDPLIRGKAEKICYEKQLELEEELGLDKIDYEKFLQDDLEINDDNKKKSKPKPKISKSNQFDLSITTKKFLRSFYDIPCDSEESLTHKEMEQILTREGNPIPKRGRVQNICLDQVLTGEWILVRDRNYKRNAIIIPYMNPLTSSTKEIKVEMGISYQKKRRG